MNSCENLKKENGGALLAILVATMLVLSIIILYQKFTSQYMKQGVHGGAVEKALLYAQTAADQMKDKLRDPSWWSNFNNGAVLPSYPILTPAPNGYAATTVRRDLNDGSLIDLYTTGYFDIHDGDSIDPKNTEKAASAIIDQKILARSVGDFFAAVPTTLQIQSGMDLTNASIYARDLVFLPGPTPTKISNAYYFSTVQMTPGSVLDTGGNPAQPTRLSVEPNLATIDATLREYYLNWAGGPGGDTLTGSVTTLVAPVNTNGVYFSAGNLDLCSAGGTLQIASPIVIYSVGSVTIHGNIVTNAPNAWLAIVSEAEIILNSSDMGTNPTLQATLITAKSLYAQPPTQTGTLTFSGGFDAQLGANLTPGWTARNYSFQAPPNTGMFLPYFVTVESYNIVKGKFSQ